MKQVIDDHIGRLKIGIGRERIDLEFEFLPVDPTKEDVWVSEHWRGTDEVKTLRFIQQGLDEALEPAEVLRTVEVVFALGR